jgi:hypothetical protein
MMKKEETIMITKFEKLHEKINMDLTDIAVNVENENKDLIEKIKHELSIITYKRRNSPSSIRIMEISGYFNKRDFKNIKLIYNTYLTINLSNRDKIKAKLSIFQDENLNNINIEINDDLVYDLDNKNFTNEILVEKMINKYKEYLVQDYKLREK